MKLNYVEFGKWEPEELEKHFAQFKEFDVDDTGFISPENLKAIMEALEVVVDMEVPSSRSSPNMRSGHWRIPLCTPTPGRARYDYGGRHPVQARR